MALHEFRIAENVATGAVGNNPAAIEQNRPGADFQDHLEVMRGNELGRGKGPDQVNEPAPAAGIEICGRLVEHKHRGPARQDPRQAYPFSLAEAEVMGGRSVRSPRPTRARHSRRFDMPRPGLPPG